MSKKVYDERLTQSISRYLTFERYVQLLENGLFLSNAGAFEDPWEGHVYHEVAAKDVNKEHLATFVHDRKKYIYVNCWHSSNHESNAMWKIYGNERSVAVHTNPECLKSLMPTLFKDYGVSPIILIPVEYVALNGGELPDRDPDKVYSITYQEMGNQKKFEWNKLMQIALSMKPKEYSYEKELRFMALDANAPQLLSKLKKYDAKKGISAKINNKDFIKKVTVSPWASDALVNSVMEVSEKFGLNKSIVSKSEISQGPVSQKAKEILG